MIMDVCVCSAGAKIASLAFVAEEYFSDVRMNAQYAMCLPNLKASKLGLYRDQNLHVYAFVLSTYVVRVQSNAHPMPTPIGDTAVFGYQYLFHLPHLISIISSCNRTLNSKSKTETLPRRRNATPRAFFLAIFRMRFAIDHRPIHVPTSVEPNHPLPKLSLLPCFFRQDFLRALPRSSHLG